VIGQTPLLLPGEAFQYMSCSVIRNPVGHMSGSFMMVNKGTEEAFEAQISRCELIPKEADKKTLQKLTKDRETSSAVSS
jgi:uncharacterized protein affecting Mg2+/Co2+ transport